MGNALKDKELAGRLMPPSHQHQPCQSLAAGAEQELPQLSW